jgi:hypothetical protein
MAQIDTLTNVGAVVSTDLALILRGGANVLGTLGSMVGQNSSAVTITGGTINGTTIGATTPASVAATTLSTTGAASLTNILLLGGTLPAAGNPSISLRSSDNVLYMQSGSANSVTILDSAQNTMQSTTATQHQWNISNVPKMTLDASGNLTTTGTATFGGNVQVNGSINTNLQSLSAWTANTRAIELTTYGAVSSNDNTGTAALSVNAYESSDGGWSRVAGTNAARFQTNYLGEHKWSNAIGAAGGTAISWVDQMTLDASGSVGIGVVPIAHHYKSLEIGNAGSQITGRTEADTYFMSGLYWSSSSTIKYAVSSVAVGYYNITNGAHSWNNSAAGTAGNDATINTAMTLDASGNLLVGCVSLPSSSVKGAGFTPTATGTDLYLGSNTTTGDNQIVFYNPNGLVGSISTSASATQYNTSSDPRLKSQFAPTTGALAKIVEAHDNQLIGEFHFLSDPDTTVWGYNAHALIDNQPGFGGTEGAGPRDMAIGEEYEPAVIDEDGNEITPAKKVTPAGVDQSKRVPLLEAAIYDLLKMNEALTARLDAAGL